MSNFSRPTIVEAISTLDNSSHAKIDRFLIKYGLEKIAPSSLGSKGIRVNALLKYLIENPTEEGPFGSNLIFEIIENIVKIIAPPQNPQTYGHYFTFEDKYPELVNSLKRDGYVIENGILIKMLPEVIDLPEKEDELNILLDKFHFDTSKGHLNQAISSHTRGDWAAANSQLRTFIESLFDSIASKLVGTAELPRRSHERREFLAKLEPPFLQPDLNEWIIGKCGFVQGFWKRLHPKGSHPGLSDEEDCTFRLHLVILVASHFLRRLDKF